MANIALIAKFKDFDGENIYDIIYNTGRMRLVVGDGRLPKTAATFIKKAANVNMIWNKMQRRWETVYK